MNFLALFKEKADVAIPGQPLPLAPAAVDEDGRLWMRSGAIDGEGASGGPMAAMTTTAADSIATPPGNWSLTNRSTAAAATVTRANTGDPIIITSITGVVQGAAVTTAARLQLLSGVTVIWEAELCDPAIITPGRTAISLTGLTIVCAGDATLRLSAYPGAGTSNSVAMTGFEAVS